MQLTLTYADLLIAAQAHINKMGVTGEVVNVDIKVGRKDRTKTTMTITVGTAEAKQQAAEAPVDVVKAEQTEPASVVQEEYFVEDIEEVAEPVKENEQSEPEVVEEVVPRSGLFRGVN